MKDHLGDSYENSMRKLEESKAEWEAFKAAAEGTYRLPLREQIRDMFQARIWKYLVARDEGRNRRESFRALFMSKEKFVKQYIYPQEK